MLGIEQYKTKISTFMDLIFKEGEKDNNKLVKYIVNISNAVEKN